MPGGETLQADSERTEGQLAVCLLLSCSRVLQLGSPENAPDAVPGKALEFHGPLAVVI